MSRLRATHIILIVVVVVMLGNVTGNIDASESVTCGDVDGDIDASGNVRCTRR